MSDRLPVAVVTGFLGSGKTTLISSLIRHPGMGETAVLVNELGEVVLDHQLLRRVDERTVVMANGCVCCTLRSDLSEELHDLLARRASGALGGFERVIIETTGLADPAPVVNTLLSDPVLRHQFELEAVVTTIDALNGGRQLEVHHESVKQAAVADTILVTKADLADSESVGRLRSQLRRLNPAAALLEVSFGAVEPRRLLRRRETDLPDFVADESAHRDDIRSFCLITDEQLDWIAFTVWLTMLVQSRGEDVLRVKGLLNVGAPGPVALDGVQHLVHPPRHLDEWPDGDHRSRIVFITRGIDRAAVEASLAAFNGLVEREGERAPAGE